MPASTTGGAKVRPGSRGRRVDCCHNQRNGTASATRQNALAVGPTSDSLTKMGANAIAQPPASNAMRASVRMPVRSAR